MLILTLSSSISSYIPAFSFMFSLWRVIHTACINLCTRSNIIPAKRFMIVTCIALFCAACGSDTAEPELSSGQASLRQQLESKVAGAVEKGFSGSVLVTVDDATLVLESYGLANRPDNIPITTNTVFDFNRIAMDFTAAAIFKLQEQGLMDVSDSISSVFPDIPSDKAQITFLQLLQHSAGFSESHSAEGMFEVLDQAQARKRIFAQELQFSPGSDYLVSASGYTLLADAIQIVSGRNYAEFVQDELFTPAGMTQSGFYGDPKLQVSHMAIGYNADTFADNNPALWPFTWATVGNGGLVTTVNDFNRWLTNTASAKVLTQSTFEAFNRQRQSYNSFESEKFGDEELIVYGNFSQYGQVTIVGDSPENGTRVIVTSNSSSDTEVTALVTQLIRTIFEPTPAGGRSPSLVFENAVNSGFSGAVLVRYGDEILLSDASGSADRELQIPNKPDTVFDIGSISKQYTGALILSLQEAGLLQVSDKLADHFDDVPQDKADITIHQLLTHTAGLPGALGDDYAPIGREDFLTLAWSSPLDVAPGTEYGYSNVGYSIAAAIAEKVSGQSYEVVLNERLLAPANIEETGYVLPNWSDRTFAIGYEEIDSLLAIDEPWAQDGPYWHLRGNGGLLSTTNDLLKWHDALTDQTVLSASSFKALHGRHVDEGLGTTFYGYGWVTEDTPVGPMHWHDGGNGFYFAVMLRFIEEDLVVVMLANEENEAALRLPWNLARAASPGLEDWVSVSE